MLPESVTLPVPADAAAEATIMSPAVTAIDPDVIDVTAFAAVTAVVETTEAATTPPYRLEGTGKIRSTTR